MKQVNREFWLGLLLLILAVTVVGCLPESDDQLEAEGTEVLMSRHDNRAGEITDIAAQNRLLASVHSATAKYQRVEMAIADGYELASACVSVPGLGGMGYHYVNFSIVNGEHDPLHPEALVYEPMKNGKFKLVAVEYIVDARLLSDRNIAPKFGQIAMDNHLHGAPLGFPHYQLHVWLWKNNPSGIYTPFNPNVSCEYGESEPH
ncbi:MAG TPA: hypothetical protein VK921_12510 [Anditalea sp.]|nr:hypothetical protein [Anditalea sp.]